MSGPCLSVSLSAWHRFALTPVDAEMNCVCSQWLCSWGFPGSESMQCFHCRRETWVFNIMASQSAEIKGIQCCFLALILANKDFSESFKEADDKILTVQFKLTVFKTELFFYCHSCRPHLWTSLNTCKLMQMFWNSSLTQYLDETRLQET